MFNCSVGVGLSGSNGLQLAQSNLLGNAQKMTPQMESNLRCVDTLNSKDW